MGGIGQKKNQNQEGRERNYKVHLCNVKRSLDRNMMLGFWKPSISK